LKGGFAANVICIIQSFRAELRCKTQSLCQYQTQKEYTIPDSHLPHLF
jgi:hypothetical protein